MPPEKAAAIILRATSRGRPRVLVGRDARAAYLLSSLTRTGWQSLAALGFAHMSAPESGACFDKPHLNFAVDHVKIKFPRSHGERGVTGVELPTAA